MIAFERVSRRYRERMALDSVSWQMGEGECVAIVGPSGAGKTTLLRLITHELSPSSGTITIGTFRGAHLPRARRALLRRTLGIVYEDFRLLNDRSVFENVALAVRITGHFADAEVVPRTLYALEEVGLQQKQAAYASELSAGEKQRAAIARAIVNRPAVVLADEPTGALEPAGTKDIIALLRRTHGEGTALLVATTRLDVAEALGGRILRLHDGRFAPDEASAPPASGPPASGDPPSLAAPDRGA